MKYNRVENSKRNMLFGAIYKVTNILLSFFNRTFVLYILGTQYLGLSSLFTSMLSILSLADLGFSSAIVYSMYKPIAEDDRETVISLMCFYKKVYRCIGLAIFLIGVIVSFFVKFIVAGEIPSDINLQILFLIQLSNIVISYLFFAYKASILSAYQREDVTSIISAIIIVIQYMIQFLLLCITKNYYLYILVLPIFTLLKNILQSIVVDKRYPWIREKNRDVLDEKAKRVLIKKVRALFAHKIGGVIANSLDNIVISAFLGLTVIAIYNNYYYIYSSLVGFLAIFYKSIQAGLGNSIAIETKESNYKKFVKLIYLNNWIVGWCTTCMFCLCQPFMELWAGKKNMLSMDSVFLLCMSFYINMSRRIIVTFKDATGIWEADQVKPVISGMLNIFLNIIFTRKIGLNGVIISTIIAFLVIEIPWEMRALFKEYFHKKMGEYIWLQIKHLILWGAILAITYCVCIRMPVVGIVELLVRGIICIILPNIILLLSWNRKVAFIKDYIH